MSAPPWRLCGAGPESSPKPITIADAIRKAHVPVSNPETEAWREVLICIVGLYSRLPIPPERTAA